MPSIAINELELNDNLDGTEVFASIEIGNGVTYQSRVSAIHYTDSVCEGQIKDSSVTNTKIANDSVDNNKIVNTDNYTVNKITTCEFSLGPGKVFCTQGATANYQWPNSTPGQANLFLTSNPNGEMSWSQTPGDGTTQTFLVNSPSTPVGTITEWVGTSPPEGWLLCNGSAVSRTTYEDLFDLFNGFTPALPYGSGDGSTTFNLPSFAGRTLIGSGSTTDSADQLSTFSLYTSGGEFDHTLTIDEIPSHDHRYDDEYKNFVRAVGINTARDVDNIGEDQIDLLNARETQSVGGDQPHNNIQPYAVVNYIIKAKSDIIIDFNPTLTGGLSALDNDGLFTSTSLDLSSSQLGVYVDETKLGFCANNKLTINDDFIVTCAEGGIATTANDTTIPTTSAVKDYVDGIYTLGINQTYETISVNPDPGLENTSNRAWFVFIALVDNEEVYWKPNADADWITFWGTTSDRGPASLILPPGSFVKTDRTRDMRVLK